MGKPRSLLIIDGYTDEPAGLGVPPYIDVYPRYIAGAGWAVDKSLRIRYVTIDSIRRDLAGFLAEASGYDVVAIIVGVAVPGKYLGGRPLTLEEAERIAEQLEGPWKVLVGAAAKWGTGGRGGAIASTPRGLERVFDAIVKGDVEAYFYQLVSEGVEKASPWARTEDMELVDRIAVAGARIVLQHPNHGYNLVVEIETYRGCPRAVSGGCSFCVTKLYGRPRQRSQRGIVAEVEALYKVGVRHIRLGRQADILVYGSRELAETEWPKPEPEELEKLLRGIRSVAPNLYTLHIDNVNPGTIARHREESRKALKVIVKYHTPGDVAALGIETADPVVVKKNNLKVYPDEALEVIRLINEVGGARGYNGLPELLPGINFVLGLMGERRETYKLNEDFLRRVYELGLNVRRINVRQVLVLPYTEMWSVGTKYLQKHRSLAKRFREAAMELSKLFLRRLLPPGSILRYLYVEAVDEALGLTYARQAGSYPLLAEIPCIIKPPRIIDVVVYGYAGRSVRALPVPLDVQKANYSSLAKIVGRTLAAKIVAARRDTAELRRITKRHPGLLAVGKGFAC